MKPVETIDMNTRLYLANKDWSSRLHDFGVHKPIYDNFFPTAAAIGVQQKEDLDLALKNTSR